MTPVCVQLNSFLLYNSPKYLEAQHSNAYVASSLKSSFILPENTFQYTHVCIAHPSAFCLKRNHTFSFQICWAIFWMRLQLMVLFFMQYLHCQQDLTLTCMWCWWFVYQYSLSLMYDPVAQQHAKWDTLKELRNRLWSQAKVIPKDSLAPRQLFGAYLASALLQKASVVSTASRSWGHCC